MAGNTKKNWRVYKVTIWHFLTSSCSPLAWELAPSLVQICNCTNHAKECFAVLPSSLLEACHLTITTAFTSNWKQESNGFFQCFNHTSSSVTWGIYISRPFFKDVQKSDILQVQSEKVKSELFPASQNMTGPISVLKGERGGSYITKTGSY